MTAIRAENVGKTYFGHRGKTVEALRGASFAVHPGEIFGLLGPNGAGKTTLLRILGTIISPTSGRCSIDGIDIGERPLEARRHIGFLSGNTKLYERLTGRETLRYFGRLYGMAEAAIGERIDQLAALLDMESFLDRRCNTLSTGQTQRVSIARVMVHDPRILILDEPTAGLDIMSSATILDFIRDARAQHKSVIFSTHYLTEAEDLCDRIALIHEGRILATGSVSDLCALTETSDLRNAFLHLTGHGVTERV